MKGKTAVSYSLCLISDLFNEKIRFCKIQWLEVSVRRCKRWTDWKSANQFMKSSYDTPTKLNQKHQKWNWHCQWQVIDDHNFQWHYRVIICISFRFFNFLPAFIVLTMANKRFTKVINHCAFSRVHSLRQTTRKRWKRYYLIYLFYSTRK